MRNSVTRIAAAAAVLIASSSIAACGSDGAADETPAAESSETAEPTEEETSEEAEPTKEEETSEEPTKEEPSPTPTVLETNYDVNFVDFGAPGAVTPPGTPLTKGQPAWLNQTVSPGGTDITGGVGVSVVEVRQLDPSLFDQYSNASEFAGYTPFAIVVQYQWLFDMPEGYDHETVDLFPVKEGGGDAEYLTGQFGFGASQNACGLVLPEFDAESKRLLTCFVGLTMDAPVVTAKYNGENYYSFVASPDNQYFNAPLLWN